MNSIFLVLAGLASGIAGAMGLGGGSVLLIYLTVFAGVDQLTAQGINLIFFLPIAAFSVAIYTKRGIIEWKNIFVIMIFGVIGSVFSSWAVSFFDAELIRKVFGGLIILYGLFEAFNSSKTSKNKSKAIFSNKDID